MGKRLAINLCCVLGTFSLVVNAWSGELRIGGGELTVDAEVKADVVTVGVGAALRGTGTVDSAVEIAGVLSPGSIFEDAGTLVLVGPVTFLGGSTFECYAVAHTQIDRVVSSGVVMGTAEVYLAKAPGAIPLDQAIIDGASESAYGSFAATGEWNLVANGQGDLLVTDLAGDSDVDDLPDWWEVFFFGGRTNALPGNDSDGDRVNEGDEEEAGTNPRDAQSVFAVVSVDTPSPGRVALKWLSVSNRLYDILALTNGLGGATSTVASSIGGDPPANTYTGELTQAASVFYRVRVRKR